MTTARTTTRILLSLLASFVLVTTAFPAGAKAPEGGAAKCVNGKAAGFPCHKIDLLAHVPITATEGGGVSDVWGWADPETGNEYAILGGAGGVYFYDVTKPMAPVYLGRMLGKPDVALPWVEMEVLNDHLYVVCDLSPCGLQIFDLKRLTGVESAVPIWRPDVVLPLGTFHTIASNPETNHIFLNGSGTVLPSPSGAPIIFDVSVPLAPVPVGVMGENGYAHDSLCVVYKGVDKRFKGNEICFNFNGSDHVVNIYDVTANPMQPELVGSGTYKSAAYVHSGALTKDQSYLISTDEADETDAGTPSTLYIWDVRNLTKPKMIGSFVAKSATVDHNVYSEEDALYHANYVNGFRILDLADASKAKLEEVAWFDTRPESDQAEFSGAWGAYPYLPSGNVLVGDMGGAFFVVRPHDDVYKSLGVKRDKHTAHKH